jgi:two-component system KDP operon response regulator KdpE
MNSPQMKVLVIDDEPAIRKLLRMGLSTQGYDILEASNGKMALEKLAEGPALIILDLGLPDIQGHELLRMIRGRNESVPIVVLSSRGDEAGKVQALDLGADDYVTAVRHGRVAPHARGAPSSASGARRAADLPHRRSLGRPGAAHRESGRQGGKTLPRSTTAAGAGAARGKVLTTASAGELWDDLTDAQYLRVMRQLRQKIETDPERPHYIPDGDGIGYCLRAPD